MPKIECHLPGHDGLWIEFRNEKWTFGDRRAILEASDDPAWLGIVLAYVTSWNLTDVDGAPVEARVGSMERVEDDVVAWILSAWFAARSERSALPKAPSPR